MAVLVAVGDTSTLRTFDGDGVAGWTMSHGQQINGLTIDDAGGVYLTGVRSGTTTTRAYASGGSSVWTADHGNTGYGVALGLSGDLWVSGRTTSSVNLRKYTASNGTLINSGAVICPSYAYACAVGPDGHAYGAGDTNSSGNRNCTKRHATDYYSIWSRGYPASSSAISRGVAVDASGNVYICGYYTSGATVWKYNSSGTLQWSKSHGGICYGIALDGAGGVYVCGERNLSTGYMSVRKYAASDGTLLWSQDHGGTCWACSYAGGRLYICGNLSGGIGWRALDASDGSILLSVTMSVNCYAIAAREFIPAGINTDCPPLALPIRLGLPSAANRITVLAPALALRLRLGAPSAPAQLPPDPQLWPAPRTYSLSIVVGDGLVSLPLASVQCRRRLGASTWLSVEVPAWSGALESLVAGGIGSEMIVWSWAVVDGVPVAGEFLRAIITEYQAERGAMSGRISITGRVQTPSYTAASRALVGVQSRGLDSAGRRTALANIDPLLRPNDTVDDGADTWAAGSIEYQITARSAWMSVLERADG